MRNLIQGVALILSLIPTHAYAEKGPSVAEVVKQTIERDYLPLNYPYDGTFLVHFFVGMEVFAATDAPFIFQFAQPVAESGRKPDVRLDRKEFLAPDIEVPEGEVIWRYHGALATWDSEQAEPTVYDVFLGQDGISRSDWLEKLNPSNEIFLAFNVGSDFIYNAGTWRAPGPDKPEYTQHPVPEVPANDFYYACDMMNDLYSGLPGMTKEEREKKHQAFKDRIKVVYKTLVKKNKVSQADFVDMSDCWY